MFRNTYQSGFFSVLYSCGSSPLELWDMHVKNGYIRRVTDEEVKSLALEISGTNVSTTYIYSPPDPKKGLGIRLPFLIMIIKNMKKYFTFEITILDDKNMHRRFRMSNFQSTTRVRPFSTSMPIGLSGGWNQIQFNLADFTRRAYGTNYLETTRLQIHANCRIRRIYFADRLYPPDELPDEFKLFMPMQRQKCVRQADVAKASDKEKEKFVSELPTEPPAFDGGEEQTETSSIAMPDEASVADVEPGPKPSTDVHIDDMDDMEEGEDEEDEQEVDEEEEADVEPGESAYEEDQPESHEVITEPEGDEEEEDEGDEMMRPPSQILEYPTEEEEEDTRPTELGPVAEEEDEGEDEEEG